MTSAQLNRLLREEHQRRLGDLYDDLVILLENKSLRCQSDLARLMQQYGQDNVCWMMGVIAEDGGMRWENI